MGHKTIRTIRTSQRTSRIALCCLIAVMMLGGQGFSKSISWKTGRIKIAGNTAFSGKSLRQIMETRPGNFFQSTRYSHAKLVSDLSAIKELYRMNGYQQTVARIDSVVYDTASKHAELFIGIVEGPRTTVDSVRITGNTALSRPRMLRSLSAKPGAPLDLEANDKDAGHIEEVHQRRGYLFCRVENSVTTDSTTHRAKVSFTIDQGPLVLTGPLRMSGLRNVRPVVVERQLGFRTGDTLSSRKIRTAIKQLYGTTLFNFVQIEPDTAGGLAGRDTIHPATTITLEEADFFTMNASVGYGSIDQFRGSVLARYSNLFALGHTISLTGSGSYLLQQARVSYSVPWIFSLPLQGELSAYVEHHNIVFLGLFDGLTFSLSHETLWNFDYRFWTSVERTEYSYPLKDTVPARSFTNTQKVGTDLSWDSRPADRRLHRGFYLIFKPELAGLGGKGTNQYYRGLIDLRAYSRPFPWMRGSNAVTVAYARGYQGGADEVPPEAQYYIGVEGIRPVRGYSQNEIVPGGGRFAVIVNAFEGQFDIYKWIGGTLFLDGGYAWNDPAKVTMRQIKWVAGPGVYFKTPIGDLQFDWGYRLNDKRWGSPYISFGQVF